MSVVVSAHGSGVLYWYKVGGTAFSFWRRAVRVLTEFCSAASPALCSVETSCRIHKAANNSCGSLNALQCALCYELGQNGMQLDERSKPAVRESEDHDE